MNRLLVILAASLTLAGCATPGSINRNLQTFKGRPVTAAIERYGVPSTERTVAGIKVYTWSSRHTEVVPTYSMAQTTGYVSGQSFQATTGQWGTDSFAAECEVNMQVDGDEVVTRVTFAGNIAGCSRYDS
jgi:uncharacterized lipoprotein YajG